MKPVQLLPSKSKVKSDAESEGSGLAGPIIGVIAVAAVGLYFGYTQMDRLESEILAAQQQQESIQSEISIEESRLEELGRRTDYASLASQAEQMVLASLGERYPYGAFLRKLTMRLPAGVWLEEISTDDTDALVIGDGTNQNMEIIGVAPDARKIASVQQWIETLPDVVSVSLDTVTTIETVEQEMLRRFTFNVVLRANEVVATEVDLPGEENLTADEVGSAGDNDSGALALTPEPVRKAKSNKQEKPEPEPQPSALEELASSNVNNQPGGVS